MSTYVVEKLLAVTKRQTTTEPNIIAWSGQECLAARLCLRWCSLMGEPAPDLSTPTYENADYWAGRAKPSFDQTLLWRVVDQMKEDAITAGLLGREVTV